MRAIMWGGASIGLPIVLILGMILAETDRALDLMYAIVSGGLFGMAIALLAAARGHSADVAMQLLFAAAAGALGGWLTAIFLVGLLSFWISGQAAILLAIFAGGIGAATASLVRFSSVESRQPSSSD